MPYRVIPFITGEYYHVYNRGLEKQPIFTVVKDYRRFIKTLFYYQIKDPKPKFSLYTESKTFPIDSSKKIVEIICYCLMPNHFHILVRQTEDGGISQFMRRFIHSYNKYKNIKYNRQGPIFQGIFKAVRVESDEQFLHLSRYIHLNPLISLLVKNLHHYPWSSFHDYCNLQSNSPVVKEDILDFFKSPQEYLQFIKDQADYGTTIEILKHIAIDDD